MPDNIINSLTIFSEFNNIMIEILIIILFLKEILLESKIWSKRLNNLFNIAIWSLFVYFCIVIILKILHIIGKT